MHADLPFPRLSLDEVDDPVSSILGTVEFTQLRDILDATASTALQLPTAQALLYAIIRNLSPSHVVEIGTYQGGTAKLICRALHENGSGLLHTVSPYDARHLAEVFPQWPAGLRDRLKFYPTNSMGFFMQANQQDIRPDIVLVDGNHDYEYALFDLLASARIVARGGFIILDNVEQAGPYRAAMTFLNSHPGWLNCGVPHDLSPPVLAFDPSRPLAGTNFFVLRAPQHYVVTNMPNTFGEIGWHDAPLSGIRIFPSSQDNDGILSLQCVFRAFSEDALMERTAETQAAIDISGDATSIDLRFNRPFQSDRKFDRYTAEPWFSWSGRRPLALDAQPVLL